jgi:signal transduction histidine kinase
MRSLLPGAPYTSPLSALMLLILAASLLASLLAWGKPKRGWLLLAGRLAAGLAVVLAGSVAAQYVFGIGLPIEKWLYWKLVSANSSQFAGRPSVQTTTAILFIGLALLAATTSYRRSIQISQALVAVGALIPWLAFLGYFSQSTSLYSTAKSSEIGISPITAACLLCLCLGIVAARPRRGLARLLRSSSTGGMALRLLLPVMLLGPLAFGWAVAYISREAILDQSTGFAIAGGATSVVLAGLAIWLSQVLDDRDAERRATEAQLQSFNASLESRVEEITGELRLHQQELEQANRELLRRATDLARSNEELEQFAYIASHDLQSPLRSISGFLQLLQSTYYETLDDIAQGWIERAVEGTTRMQSMILDVLSYSRIDSRSHPATPFDLNDVFDEVAEMLQGMIEEAGAEVTRGQLPELVGDRMQFLQLFQNLIGNALKYRSEQAPSIGVTAKRDAEDWHIAVRDNGIGIDESQHQRIFHIFGRGHSGQQYEGSGIGLALCQRIAYRHGGRIWVESQPGKGSTFWVSMPVTERKVA